MLAAPVDIMPEGPGLVHEPKRDGWRMNAFREADGPYLQSRAGRNLSSCDTQDPDRNERQLRWELRLPQGRRVRPPRSAGLNEGQLRWELRSVCVLYAAAVTGSTPQ